jgi:DNA-binding CsgD family transcriptional regulator
MWRQGALLEEIGKRLGITIAAVSTRAGRLGLPPRKLRVPRHAVLPGRVEKSILKSYSEGVSLKDISRQYRISIPHFFSILRRRRIPARSRPFNRAEKQAKIDRLKPQIKRLRKMGRSFQSIVDEFGLPVMTVREIAKEVGVLPRINKRTRANMVARLRQVMDHDGRNDMELAKAIGYTRSTTELFVYGTAIAKWSPKLAKALKIDQNWILEGTSKPKFLKG